MKGTKNKYLLIIGIAIAALSLYIYGTTFSLVHLNIVLACRGDNTQSMECYENSMAITLNDTLLDQSPKLKEGLIRVLTTEPYLTNPPMYIVNMNMGEFDSMNRMLVSTEQDALQHYAKNSNPTLALFPKGNSIVFVNYGGNSYQLVPTYSFFRPPGQYLD